MATDVATAPGPVEASPIARLISNNVRPTGSGRSGSMATEVATVEAAPIARLMLNQVQLTGSGSFGSHGD